MLDDYQIPKNEFITWALSQKSWKLIKVKHEHSDYGKTRSEYAWITESGKIIKLETVYKGKVYTDSEYTTVQDGFVSIEIERKKR
tara:strand:- start:436 stop:690 length:255 start_codon:yes stop_codon:yes gene_type:complete